MGKKLTSWERAQRERQREEDRRRKATAVKRRRDAARSEKEAKIKQNIATAEKAVQQYEQFYDSITNLHLHKIGTKNFLSKFKNKLESPSILKKPKNPGKFTFKEKKELKILKKESEYDFNSYCKAENKSTFFLFVMLFGTEKKHKEYLTKRKSDYDNLKIKEEKRKIKEETDHNLFIEQYENDMIEYNKKLSEFQTTAKDWFTKLSTGDLQIQEEASELIFPIEYSFNEEHEMSNPTDSDVGYKITSSELIDICINLPSDLDFLPEKGLKMTVSGKAASEFKISQKNKTEAANRVLCSIAFSYIKSIFNVLKNIKTINIEVGIAGADPKTGNAADLIFLTIKLSRTEYDQINLSNIDVINAVENFDYQYRSTDSKKNFEGTINREELIWATEDDKNIKINKLIQKSFRECFYQ